MPLSGSRSRLPGKHLSDNEFTDLHAEAKWERFLLPRSDQKRGPFGLVAFLELFAFHCTECAAVPARLTLKSDGTFQSRYKSHTAGREQDGVTLINVSRARRDDRSAELRSELRRAGEDGQGQQRGGGGWPGMKTAKHLPLSLGVQAALEVLALPTQEECDTLQPSQAKLSQASCVGSSGFYSLYTVFHICVFSGSQAAVILKGGLLSASVWRLSLAGGRARAEGTAHALSNQVMQPWLDGVISACYNTQPFTKCNWVIFLWLYWFGQEGKVYGSWKEKNGQILWIKLAKAVWESRRRVKVGRVRKSNVGLVVKWKIGKKFRFDSTVEKNLRSNLWWGVCKTFNNKRSDSG